MKSRALSGAEAMEKKMPKQGADAFIMSENMWGKPLPSTARKVADDKKKVTRMQTEDDIDSDVDAELEEGEDTEVDLADENDDVLVSDEALAEVEADEPDDDEEEEEDSDEDDDDLDPEDVVDEEQDEVEATVAEDEEEDANNRKVVMSEKKSGADHIRDEINKRKAAGDSMRGVDIVAALAKRKIEVSPAQVSQLLKKAGMGGAPRAKKTDADAKSRVAAKGKAKTEAAPPATPRMLPKGRAVTSTTTTLPMTQLRAAAAFLSACDGCYATAEEILSTHKQLGTVYDVSR